MIDRALARYRNPTTLIATQLGFPDASNFIKYFARRVDVTPTVFRQQFRSGTTLHA